MQTNYVLSEELAQAIKIAEITKRPLLIKGEPGTGKTLLADFYAESNKLPLYRWHVKSTTTAKDGLYFYDALTRLNDARFGDKSDRDVNNIEDYIRLEPMGQAFDHEGQCVLLIDEIDKADIEFPNDLLLELDRMQFTILETGKMIEAKTRPLVIITSNSEKELPDAFLRRCIFHYIDFPNELMMKKIVNVHFPEIDKKLLERAMELFYRIREYDDLRKKPSTSEFLDWVNVLLHQGADIKSIGDFPYAGSLIKSEEDMDKLK
jgi:MoxR-like ATPase